MVGGTILLLVPNQALDLCRHKPAHRCGAVHRENPGFPYSLSLELNRKVSFLSHVLLSSQLYVFHIVYVGCTIEITPGAWLRDGEKVD